MNREFQEDLENFNRRVQEDDRLKDLLTAPLHVINNSGKYALQVGGITIQETTRLRADDFSHILDILCAINVADWEQIHDREEEEPDYHEPYPPDFGPPGSGAVVTEYEVGTYDQPW